MAPASSKEFLDIQATVECGFTLKLVRDMIKTYNQLIANGLEKYMSFTMGKNIIFIDSLLFMNSSLDKLVKNVNDFKYLSIVFKE